jgi:hypothetical protein
MKMCSFLWLSVLLFGGCYKNTESLSDSYEWDKFRQKKKTDSVFAFSLEPEHLLEIYWQNLDLPLDSTRILLSKTRKVQVALKEPEAKTLEYELSPADYDKILQKLQNPDLAHIPSKILPDRGSSGFNLVLTFWLNYPQQTQTKSVFCRSTFQPEIYGLLEDFSPLLKGKLAHYDGMLSLFSAHKKEQETIK